MHSIHKMAPFNYYPKDARKKDYYSDASIGTGEWFGRGAMAWGFVGEVTRAAFQRMVQGFAADGKTKCAQNAGRADRYPGDDHCFYANSHVNFVWGQERSLGARRGIERAVVDAAKDALRFLEDSALFSRRGKGGSIVEQAIGMVAALWLHFTNRRNEPGLHVHACVGNQVLRRDGTSGTILAITAKKKDKGNRPSRSALYALKMEAGRVFQESLRARMEALGYRTADADAKHGYFSIVGVPKDLVDRFGSRRKEILADMNARGVSGARQAAWSAIATRPAKKAARLEDLFSGWRDKANGFDPATIRAQTAAGIANPVVAQERREAALAKARAHAVAAPVDRQRITTTSDLSRKGTLREEAKSPLAHTAPRDSNTDSDDERLLRAAALGAKLLRRSRRNRSHVLTRANVHVAAKQVEYLQRTRLTTAEKSALIATTRRRGSVQSLGRGASAERIELILSAAHVAWKRQGYRVLLATTTHAEAERLEKRTGIRSITTSGLLKGLATNRGLLRGYDSAMKKSFALGLGFRSGASFLNYALSASGRWLGLDKKTVLIVDNPGLSLMERASLMKRAHRCGAKLVFMDETRDAAEISETLLRPRHRLGSEDFQQQFRREREHEQERSR